MCFYLRQSKDASRLEARFQAKALDAVAIVPTEIYNGFGYPQTHVITNTAPGVIQVYHWGLLPSWTNDISFRKNTLNAKRGTQHEKPSFKHLLHQPCLVLADGFYEWQWLDEKGKNKQKYLLSLPDDGPFALAGLWNIWPDLR